MYPGTTWTVMFVLNLVDHFIDKKRIDKTKICKKRVDNSKI